MVLTERLTPETFLSLPRRGVIAPNSRGTLGLYSVSTHEFGKGTKKEWRVMELATGNSYQLTDDEKVQDVNWMPDSNDTVIWLRPEEGGHTQMLIAYLANPGRLEEPSSLGVIEGHAQGLRLKVLDDHSIAVSVVCLANSDGSMYREGDDENKPLSSARIYDDINVREWDTYVKPQKYSIFYSKITKHHNRKYSIAENFQNVAIDSGLEVPSDMYGGRDSPTDRYDLGSQGIVFTARDPNPDPTKPQYLTASDVYFVPIEDWNKRPASNPVKVVLQSDNALGTVSNPRFSPDGTMVAYLKRLFSNEADVRLFMGHVGSQASFDVWKMVIGSSWDLVPESLEYAPHGQSMFITADNCGRFSLFELELQHGARPRAVATENSVRGHYSFQDEKGDLKLLVSASSHVETSIYTIYDPILDVKPLVVSAATRFGRKLGLSSDQVSEMWFEGSEETFFQAWMLKPSNFDENKKWPLVLMIHGGPEDAFRDAWHWRWNAALWAEQGYVVVQPNFTGSTGFGVAFTNGIYNQWGGRPFQDLVNCMEHLSQVSYIDMDRAVVAGGSYGGYMVNWILGQPFAKKFKAAICHDSVFDLRNAYLYSDEVSGINDMGGPGFSWLNADNLDKWNPARPDLLKNWRHGPPTLFIHSDKDYRCVVTDGLAAFKTLRCQGVQARFLNFPDENHFVQKPENALVWHRTVFEWMERWVGKGPTEERRTGESVGLLDRGVVSEVRDPMEWWN
ncbi:prolyl oligopeptidase [Coniochaeta ligniaria NRRL 30616]|uniref:Dipeptidyl-peptidase V n=1 Tax=Coniochaeta ligniaria NRRL 30616 TaxID=1408157 RepID=A0A1J7IZG5_9PEZI|nr:prolyl oligopeptidase [Coniochaeta ligniaria NRRL 30616]